MSKLSASRIRALEAAVSHYEGLRTDFDREGRYLLDQLTNDARLKPFIHSGKYRTKDPAHLIEKLIRKELERKSLAKEVRPPLVSAKNILDRVGDLAGVRLLHLHTKQMANIHPLILEILELNRLTIREDPIVYIWDIEYKSFFEEIGIQQKERDEMYTSVHYVVSPAARPEMKIELQVRTLMEEVWGEVFHTINYPVKTTVLACREQLMVLARITSGCTRLVDSIFASYTDANNPADEQD